MQSAIRNSVVVATGLLVIPILGEQFVEGWNWEWHDFIFAWVFWLVMSLTIIIVVQKSDRFKLIAGGAVFLCFAMVWALLATG